MTNYFKLYSNKVNRSFERKSKIPFTKWYVKKYHDVFKAKSKDLAILIKITDNDEVKNKLKLEIKTMNKNLNKLKKNLKEKVVSA
jgi:protein subunit release factor A